MFSENFVTTKTTDLLTIGRSADNRLTRRGCEMMTSWGHNYCCDKFDIINIILLLLLCYLGLYTQWDSGFFFAVTARYVYLIELKTVWVWIYPPT